MHTLQKQTDCYNSRVVVWFTLVLEADCIRQPVPLYFPLLFSFWNEEKRRKQQGNYTSVDVLYKSHKKVFWMKTSACRDGTTDNILKKKQPNNMEWHQNKCCEVKIEESEKAGSHWESNSGHLLLEPPCSALPLSYNSRTTNKPHNPLYVATIFTFLYFRLITFISSMRQDALDTTTLSHHPYILCHFSSFACSLSVGSYNFLH